MIEEMDLFKELDVVFIPMNRRNTWKFGLTAIYKGIVSLIAIKNILKSCQIFRKKENSRRKQILAII